MNRVKDSRSPCVHVAINTVFVKHNQSPLSPKCTKYAKLKKQNQKKPILSMSLGLIVNSYIGFGNLFAKKRVYSILHFYMIYRQRFYLICIQFTPVIYLDKNVSVLCPNELKMCLTRNFKPDKHVLKIVGVCRSSGL